MTHVVLCGGVINDRSRTSSSGTHVINDVHRVCQTAHMSH